MRWLTDECAIKLFILFMAIPKRKTTIYLTVIYKTSLLSIAEQDFIVIVSANKPIHNPFTDDNTAIKTCNLIRNWRL